ncbi:hypothetical protein K2X30_14595 [bacterium]|nr:hypothetical protein [bacterium]
MKLKTSLLLASWVILIASFEVRADYGHPGTLDAPENFSQDGEFLEVGLTKDHYCTFYGRSEPSTYSTCTGFCPRGSQCLPLQPSRPVGGRADVEEVDQYGGQMIKTGCPQGRRC